MGPGPGPYSYVSADGERPRRHCIRGHGRGAVWLYGTGRGALDCRRRRRRYCVECRLELAAVGLGGVDPVRDAGLGCEVALVGLGGVVVFRHVE